MGDQSAQDSKIIKGDDQAEKERLQEEIDRVEQEVQKLKRLPRRTASAGPGSPRRPKSKLAEQWLLNTSSHSADGHDMPPQKKDDPLETWRRQASSRRLIVNNDSDSDDDDDDNNGSANNKASSSIKKQRDPLEAWRKQASSRNLNSKRPMATNNPITDKRAELAAMRKTGSVRKLVEQKESAHKPIRAMSQRNLMANDNDGGGNFKNSKLAERFIQKSARQEAQLKRHAERKQRKDKADLEAWRKQASTRNLTVVGQQ